MVQVTAGLQGGGSALHARVSLAQLSTQSAPLSEPGVQSTSSSAAADSSEPPPLPGNLAFPPTLSPPVAGACPPQLSPLTISPAAALRQEHLETALADAAHAEVLSTLPQASIAAVGQSQMATSDNSTSLGRDLAACSLATCPWLTGAVVVVVVGVLVLTLACCYCYYRTYGPISLLGPKGGVEYAETKSRGGPRPWVLSMSAADRGANKTKSNWNYKEPPPTDKWFDPVSSQEVPSRAGFDPCASSIAASAASGQRVAFIAAPSTAPPPAPWTKGLALGDGVTPLPPSQRPPRAGVRDDAMSEYDDGSMYGPGSQCSSGMGTERVLTDPVSDRAHAKELSQAVDEAEKMEHRYSMAFFDEQFKSGNMAAAAGMTGGGAGGGVRAASVPPTAKAPEETRVRQSAAKSSLSPDEIANLRAEDIERMWHEKYTATLDGGSGKDPEHKHHRREYRKPVEFMVPVTH